MVSFKRIPHATDATLVALIICHLVVWFQSMGGVEGIENSYFYPHLLVVVPLTVWVTALGVFHLIVNPLALGAQYACNEFNIPRLYGLGIFLVVIAVIVALPANGFGGTNAMGTWITWVAYLGIGFATFWLFGTKD